MKRALVAVAIVGCAAPTQDVEPIATLDRATFEAKVQLVLADRCASPDCHGTPQRGLVLYAPLQYRADPTRTWILEPLTEAELRYDFEAATIYARLPAWTGGSMLLKKPLADNVGEHHGGGATFADEKDRDWQAMRDWVEGTSAARSPVARATRGSEGHSIYGASH